MKNYVDLYIHHLAAEGKSPETLSQYKRQLEHLEAWLIECCGADFSSTHIRDVTGVMLTEYYQHLYERQLAVSTRNNYTVIIKEFFEFLEGVGAIAKSPAAVLRCVREKATPEDEQPHMYTQNDVQALLHSIATEKPRRNCLRDTAVVALIFATGLRASEVCNLNCSQMDEIRSGTLYCKRKGGDWKNVAVGSFAVGYIDRYLLSRGTPAADEPLFLSQKGRRLTRTALWKSLATKQRRADVSTGVHILRHTVLSAIDHDGGSALARDVGGHSSVVITNRYVHTSADERKHAVDHTPMARFMA